MANFKAQAIAEETANNCNGIVRNHKDLFFVLASKEKTPIIYLYKGNRKKLQEAYKFRSNEEREKWIQKEKEQCDIKEKRKTQLKEICNKRKKENIEKAKINEIICVEWGYSMTLVSFYQIIEIKTKTSFLVKELCKKVSSPYTGNCTPVKNDFFREESYIAKINFNGHFLINGDEGEIWDGKSKYFNSLD